MTSCQQIIVAALLVGYKRADRETTLIRAFLGIRKLPSDSKKVRGILEQLPQSGKLIDKLSRAKVRRELKRRQIVADQLNAQHQEECCCGEPIFCTSWFVDHVIAEEKF